MHKLKNYKMWLWIGLLLYAIMCIVVGLIELDVMNTWLSLILMPIIYIPFALSGYFYTAQDITWVGVAPISSSCQLIFTLGNMNLKNFTVRHVRNGIIMRVANDGSLTTQEGVTGYFNNLMQQ